MGRSEGNLEAIAGLEGDVGSEGAGEQMSIPWRSQAVGMTTSWGGGWTMLIHPFIPNPQVKMILLKIGQG